ncbi:hypothetical protein D922_01432 [Enterococcus faecalis 06-MB-DW-09]|nr:hypothetical protein D922_01432 [Enterococcus faecalis 06-MB-DW-09]
MCFKLSKIVAERAVDRRKKHKNRSQARVVSQRFCGRFFY